MLFKAEWIHWKTFKDCCNALLHTACSCRPKQYSDTPCMVGLYTIVRSFKHAKKMVKRDWTSAAYVCRLNNKLHRSLRSVGHKNCATFILGQLRFHPITTDNVHVLVTGPLTHNLSSALQSWKWQLICMIPRRIMRPSIARDSKQLDPQCSTTDIPPLQSAH